MSKSRKARRTRQRRRVTRTERVKPSALAEAKKRPWIMQTLLQRGPDADGISAEQFEAGIEIVDAYDALTRSVGWPANAANGGIINRDQQFVPGDDLSPRDVRLIAIYFTWAEELLRRVRVPGTIIVDWITDARSLGTIGLPLLIRALDLWTQQRDDWRPAVDTASSRGVDSARRGVPEAQHHDCGGARHRALTSTVGTAPAKANLPPSGH